MRIRIKSKTGAGSRGESTPVRALFYILFLATFSVVLRSYGMDRKASGEHTLPTDPFSHHVSADSTYREQLEKQIPVLMRKARIPGLAIAVIHPGKETWTGTFGYQNTHRKILMTEESVFEAASLSKPVFAYLMIKLVEDGVLDLDTPFLEKVPETYLIKTFFHTRDYDDRYRQITLRMVLSHQTGLPNWRAGEEAPAFVSSPGKEFIYSGEGLMFAQRAVEYLTGVSLERLMEEKVFRPLGMTRSCYVWKKEFRHDFAVGYDMRGKESKKEKMKQAMAPYSIYTTVNDYACFLKALIDGRGLQPGTMEEMLCVQIRVSPSIGWGLGVGVQETGRGIIYWHWGDNANFRNFVAWNPEEKKGVVYFTNSFFGLSIGEDLVRLAMGGEHPAFHSELMSLYDRYDSAEMRFLTTLVDKGLDEARKENAIVREEVLVDFAIKTLKEGKISNAISILEFSVQFFPLSYQVSHALGDAYRIAGDIDRAVSQYKQSLEINPQNIMAREWIQILRNMHNRILYDRHLIIDSPSGFNSDPE
jgi:CubicO group peptidase (beta-lactamase class C family)